MTTYKPGDEVLVRFKIFEITECTYPYHHVLCNLASTENPILVDQDRIYSLAPEFDCMEEIEVSDSENFNDRVVGRFISKWPTEVHEYCCLINEQMRRFNYARKIQKPREPETRIIDGKKFVEVME